MKRRTRAHEDAAGEAAPERYRVVAAGVNFPGESGEVRAENGAVLTDLPDRVRDTLLEMRAIEPFAGDAPAEE